MIWLSGCATVSSDGSRLGDCPLVVQYSREFQAEAAEELALLPKGSAITEMLKMYESTTEEELEEFAANKHDGLPDKIDEDD